ncbi:MAG: radical SAM protein, partial [Acidobacteria bacterium]|nr:radical SAM protein [Acidobacteriota bacterium]
MTQPVCLITPPSMFLLDERVFMSLGVLRVAASLEQASIPVEMLDLSGIENYEQAVRDHVQSSKAEVYGVTATSPQLPSAICVCRAIRSANPAARIILGGPHVTLVNAARKLEEKDGRKGRAARAFDRLCEDFDVLVAGDGELAVLDAIRPGSPKLVDGDEPKTELFLDSQQLSAQPMPARHLVDVDSYHYNIDGVRALSLICQLGCPFGCGFCGGRASPSLRRVRLRSVDSVVSEIAHLHAVYGVNGFMLYDDELNVNPRMIELMRAIADKANQFGVEFKLRGFIKAELFTDEQAEAMHQAGFRWILTGFESGSPRILKNSNKRATLEENTRCIEIARRHGLKVKALMSIGHPGESAETIEQTLEWLVQMAVEDFDVTVLSVYPGSPYYDQATPHPSLPGVWVYSIYGDNLYSYEVDYTTVADYYKGDPHSGYTSYVYTDYLSTAEIVTLRDHVEADVRRRLKIPFNQSATALRYEHSMGQSGVLPANILRTSG